METIQESNTVEEAIDYNAMSGLELAEEVLKILQKSDIDFTKRLTKNTLSILELELNVPKVRISKCLSYWKKKNGFLRESPKRTPVVASMPKRRMNPPRVDFQNICLENNLLRKNPSKEVLACRTMTNALIRKLPIGGIGLMIGTPAPFCAAAIEKNKLFLVDNLEVAIALRATTDEPPSMIIGNIIDPVKAEIKAQHWRSNNSTNDFKISTEPVDRDSYFFHLTMLAQNNDLVKVVLLTSGLWSGSQRTRKKYGFDTNFRDPSIYLTSRYPNLHVLAMTMGRDNRTYVFQVKYVHDGKTEDLILE